VDADRAGRALDRVLAAIGPNTDPDHLEALGQAAQALAQAGARVGADQAGRALGRVLDAIGETTEPYPLQGLGQAAAALAALAGPREPTVAAIVNTLKYPHATLAEVDEILLASLRILLPDMPADEKGFWVVIEWLRDHYPNIDFDGPPRQSYAEEGASTGVEA
jgi:hypothetical protein